MEIRSASRRRLPGVSQRLTRKKSHANGRPFAWPNAISRNEWALYRSAMHALRDADIPFMLGGGFALATFTGRWRDTKDIDFYIHPQDRERTVQALSKAGFGDYYSRLPYDRKWIYRSTKRDVIVDVIWSMANQRAQVDDGWFERAGEVTIRRERLRVLPAEEFMWCKLYILQRDHCDWTDVFNLLYATGSRMDWSHLLLRVGEDALVLKAVLMVYSWLCPGRAARLPSQLWRRLGLIKPPPSMPPFIPERIRMLDSRYWFGPFESKGRKLTV